MNAAIPALRRERQRSPRDRQLARVADLIVKAAGLLRNPVSKAKVGVIKEDTQRQPLASKCSDKYFEPINTKP